MLFDVNFVCLEVMGMQMDIKLHYGKGFVSFSVPEGRVADVIVPWGSEDRSDNQEIVRNAVSCADIDGFRGAVSGKRICVLVADGSRDMPIGDILSELNSFLVDSAFVRFMICTGTHDCDTEGNRRVTELLEKAAVESGLGDFDVCVHDCLADEFVSLGVTARGTKIEYNCKIDDFDVFLVLSDVKFHYFAGYSNPVKYFIPGVGSYAAVEGNHSLALDERSAFGVHPWHSDAARRGNPLAADQLECMERIVGGRSVFAFVTISSSSKMQWAGFGDAKTVSRAAFDVADQRNMRKVEPVKYLIVSPGGDPNDVDLYISQRALELTKQAVLAGGEVLFVSACPDGVGSERTLENFYNRLTLPLDEIFESIKSEYRLFSHKPYKFAEMIRRLSKIWVYSQMPDDVVEAGHMYPAGNIQDIVDKWVASDPNARIMIVDGANKIGISN